MVHMSEQPVSLTFTVVFTVSALFITYLIKQNYLMSQL
jgi:hypothetical protein